MGCAGSRLSTPPRLCQGRHAQTPKEREKKLAEDCEGVSVQYLCEEFWNTARGLTQKRNPTFSDLKYTLWVPKKVVHVCPSSELITLCNTDDATGHSAHGLTHGQLVKRVSLGRPSSELLCIEPFGDTTVRLCKEGTLAFKPQEKPCAGDLFFPRGFNGSADKNCSIRDSLEAKCRSFATHFVSWTWSYSIDTVFEALERTIPDRAAAFVWMCFFCNNQNDIIVRGSTVGSDDLAGIFLERLKKIGRVIMIFDTYDTPIYTSRVWTVFEVFQVCQYGIQHEVAFPLKVQRMLEATGSCNLAEVAYVISESVDVQHAAAWSKQDEQKIKSEIVDKYGGFQVINKIVREALVLAMSDAIKDVMLSILNMRITPDLGAVSQQLMCEHFLPLIQARGQIMQKVVGCWARPLGHTLDATPGTISTYEDGRLVSLCSGRSVTKGAMLVRAMTTHAEEYVLPWDKFEQNYEVSESSSPSAFESARTQDGFRFHKSVRCIQAYRVEEADMQFVPSGRFWATYGSLPVPLQPGDFLVTDYPEKAEPEVYMIPTSTLVQTYKPLDGSTSKMASSYNASSQKDMIEHFLPILKAHGQVMRKVVGCLARRARAGEDVTTVQGGRVIGVKKNCADTDFVIKALTGDREEYVVPADKFALNYDQNGAELDCRQPGNKYLCEQGFQMYASKQYIRAYKVTEVDMQFVKSGFFCAAYSEEPVRLDAGDFLVTGYPEEFATEVYPILSSTLMQTYEGVDSQQGVTYQHLTQKQMCDHFLPIIKKHGFVMKKCVGCMARTARPFENVITLEDGKVQYKWRNDATNVDHQSMVVKSLTGDRQEYVLPKNIFEQNYYQDSSNLDLSQPGNKHLAQEGFRLYSSRRFIRAYKVGSHDVSQLPSGYFWARYGDVPTKLSEGDFLVASYPDALADEVYPIKPATLEQTYTNIISLGEAL